jgi:N-methylhydantoinase A/acetophenone carboxylase
MGGTSLDLATLDGGVPRRDEMPEVLGMRLAIPMTATESIAAGGGSIASVVGGAVEVGPESAGASPGPACYGRGGRLATVTDANLILGYLGDGVLGGRLELDRGLAEEAIRRNVCAQLDVSLEEGADLIRRRVDEKMAHEIRGKLEREGLDPGETALFAIGGGGPVHGCSMAELAGIRVVYGFPFGPVFSAFGSSTLDVSHRYSLRPTDLAAIEDPVAAAELVTGLVHQAAIDLKGEGLLWRPRTLTLTAIGSEDEDPVQMRLPEDGEVDAEMLQVLVATAGGESLLAMYLEVRVELEPWTPVLADLIGHPATTPGRRQVRWAGHSQNAAMFELEGLRAGASFDGPAIVVATGTSFVVPSGWTCQIDGSGNPVMRLLAGAS